MLIDYHQESKLSGSVDKNREEITDIYVQKTKVDFQSSQKSPETSTLMKIMFKKKKKEDNDFLKFYS